VTSADLAATLMRTYDTFRSANVSPVTCKHATVHRVIDEYLARDGTSLSAEVLGASIEGRTIRMITCGTGPVHVLLWSQMHGDEATATLALLDMFNLLSGPSASEGWMREMLTGVALHVIPMLNPDGAERVQRLTAVGIDINRDALKLLTPEARILREAQKRLSPAFGFNLHDQDPNSVGQSTNVTTIALLAPAADPERTATPGRQRAMKVAALIATMLKPYIAGHCATYSDTFEPRAFGDNIQRWGTSTVLIESGQWPDDPDKTYVRKLNVVALFVSLHAIAAGSYESADLSAYNELEENGDRMLDIIVRGARVTHASGWTGVADIGLTKTTLPAHENARYAVKSIGDLSTFGALKTIDGLPKPIDVSAIGVDKSFSEEQLRDLLGSL
jgi:hypothetical protein